MIHYRLTREKSAHNVYSVCVFMCGNESQKERGKEPQSYNGSLS